MTATNKAVEDASASAVLAAARRIARRLGNPTPVLSWTLRAGQRLLSIATALPETAPDPYAALRGLLQPQARTGRGTPRRERTPFEARATTPARSGTAARREPAPLPSTRRLDTGPVSARPVSAGPVSAGPVPTAPVSIAPEPQVRAAGAATRDTGPARSHSSRITPAAASAAAPETRLQRHAPAVPASSAEAAASGQQVPGDRHVSQPPAASREVLAQRRRRLRDRLETRTPGATLPAAVAEPTSIATAAALLGFPATSERMIAASEPAMPTAAPLSRIEPAAQRTRSPAPSTGTSNERAAAVPPAEHVSSPGHDSNTRAITSVRRLLPPRAPLATFADSAADSLLDAAHRHGVDPA